MTKPVSAVPEIFATATSPLPLADLDSNFSYLVTQINDISTYSNYAADSGTLNAIVLNYPTGVGLSGLNAGTMVQFKPANQNTGSVTLQIKINNVNVGSAAPILDAQGNAMTAGLLKTNVVYCVIYDGTNWSLQSLAPTGTPLPSYTGNALNLLRVNSSETGIEWSSAGQGLPSTTGNNGKFLWVDAQTGSAAWSNIVSGSTGSGTFGFNVQTTGTTTLTTTLGCSGSTVSSTIRLYNSTFNDWASITCSWTGSNTASLDMYAPYTGGHRFYTTPFAGSSTLRAQIDVSGNFGLQTVGTGFRVKEGSNAKQGTAVLTTGTATVANTSVTANSRIFLTSQADAGTPGFLRVSARNPGVSFTITSSSAEDTSSVAYIIFEPA